MKQQNRAVSLRQTQLIIRCDIGELPAFSIIGLTVVGSLCLGYPDEGR